MWPWRNCLEHLPGKIMRTTRKVIDGKDSNHRLLAVQNCQSAHAFIPHQARCLRAILVLEAARNKTRHDFTRRGPRWILASSYNTTTDIAVRYQANRLSILLYRKYTDAHLMHLSRAFARRRGRSDRLYFR